MQYHRNYLDMGSKALFAFTCIGLSNIHMCHEACLNLPCGRRRFLHFDVRSRRNDLKTSLHQEQRPTAREGANIMAERLRHNYGDYDCNRQLKAVDDTVSTSSLPSSICNLDNNTHPIFKPTSFPGARYKVLCPALQLASHLIDTDCLLSFWYALFFGKREPLHDGDGHDHLVRF